MFKKIAIMGRHEDPRVSEPMTVLADYLAQAGIEVLAAEDMSLAIAATRIPESELADAADLIIAIGGDGAMLYAGQLARRGDLPLLGINRGRLGFLADVTPEEMLDSVGHVLAGEFTTDKRLVLEARLERPDEPDTTALALNDVVLQRRETGRTLSCGGPIIEPRLDAVVVVPVAPHTLSDRPIVIPADLGIELRLLERENTRAEIMADGHSMGEIRPQDRLLVAASETRLTLLHPPGYDFFGILRSKLHWGHDSRKRDLPPEDA
jgi:NAD+ kinase